LVRIESGGYHGGITNVTGSDLGRLMATCAFCGNMILFGGIKEGELRFCNAICQSNGSVLTAAATVPEAAAQDLARQIHFGPCPRCKGPGPVDIHNSHWVWSAVVFSRWGSQRHVSCRHCAFKSQVGNLVFSAGLGWWGFPWGFVLTPVQVVRNVIGIASPPDPSMPSARLVQLARVQLVSQPKR
jgi:hypothetical protein